MKKFIALALAYPNLIRNLMYEFHKLSDRQKESMI